jgi:hypothetical protein
MGSTKPIFGDEYRNLVRPTTVVDKNTTHAHSVCRTSSGRDLYDNF